jgi:hypothetical protein
MTSELHALLRFLYVVGNVATAAAIVAILPVLAFLVWLMLPRQ